ncbi:sulfur oxidoreductase [Candidatus Bathyarchaeota archaeon]|nr:MAG: sulfur oxidoreductase [Candidatus Bathyarchaeota archaeon]
MPTISFLFFSGPYQSESPETTIELAKAALDKGVNVKIFCYMDAVNCVKVGQKKVPGVTNIEEQFRELIARGADVRLCTLCMLVRGTKAFIEGAKRAGTPDIADIVEESDRVLVIS